MRILLIEPPFHSFMHYDRWYYPTSLAQLAAVSHAANHEVFIYDGDKYFYKDLATRERSIFIKKQQLYYDNVDNDEYYIWQHMRQILDDFKPEVVGVSVYTCKLKSALNTLKLVRRFNPEIKTCVGGVHVTAVPDTFVSENYIDGVFVGYADKSFPKWLDEGCPKGIIKEDLSNLDFKKLPYVRRKSLLFPDYYTARDLSHISMSRGCLGRCTFCSNSFIWCGKPIFRSKESITAELTEIINEWNIKDVVVGDASFSDTPVESKNNAKILKDLRLHWSANVRWSTINKELLEYFINCGLRKIFVGLESGSDKILKFMRKGCTKNMIREKARMINSLDIEWQLHAIAGFPIETVEDMKETMELALEISPTSISLNSLSPLPGTDVYNSIPGMTPDLASQVNQLFPNCCFSQFMDIETYRGMFLKMTEVFDDYNKTKLKLSNIS